MTSRLTNRNSKPGDGYDPVEELHFYHLIRCIKLHTGSRPLSAAMSVVRIKDSNSFVSVTYLRSCCGEKILLQQRIIKT